MTRNGAWLHVHPAALAMAREDGLDEADGAEAVGEGGEVGRRRQAVADGAVDGEEVVLEPVGVALGVAARVVGERPGRRVEQAGVLDERLVRPLAAADPERVRALLI